MGVATATAARILRGQRMGKSGEEHELAWDRFPAVALAKVRNHFMQYANLVLPSWQRLPHRILSTFSF